MKIGIKFSFLDFMTRYENHSKTVRQAKCSRQWRMDLGCRLETPMLRHFKIQVSSAVMPALNRSRRYLDLCFPNPIITSHCEPGVLLFSRPINFHQLHPSREFLPRSIAFFNRTPIESFNLVSRASFLPAITLGR